MSNKENINLTVKKVSLEGDEETLGIINWHNGFFETFNLGVEGIVVASGDEVSVSINRQIKKFSVEELVDRDVEAGKLLDSIIVLSLTFS